MEGDSSAGWDVRQDEASGQVYYWNAITGETSWEPPPHFASGVALPWTTAFDENGQMYYMNVDTMETQWTPPSTAQISGTSASDVLTTTGGRGRRPSTAEQMVELNRLLSGDMGDDEDPSPTEGVSQVGAKPAAVSGGNSTGNSPSSLVQTPGTQIQGNTSTGDSCSWAMIVNEADGLPYYYNNATGECLWDPPEEFLRTNQSQLQQQQHGRQEQQESDKATNELSGSAKSSLAATTEHSNIQDSSIPSLEVSKPNSARPKSGSTQAVAMAEFEEKMNRAITAVLNKPVNISNVLPVHTPSEQQIVPQPEKVADSDASKRNSEGSPRASGGTSRPSSGDATTRPLTPSVDAVASRSVDDVSLAQENDTIHDEPSVDILEEKEAVHNDQISQIGPDKTEIDTPVGDDEQLLAATVKDGSRDSTSEAFRGPALVTSHNDELEPAANLDESAFTRDGISEALAFESAAQNETKVTVEVETLAQVDDQGEKVPPDVSVEDTTAAVEILERASRPDEADVSEMPNGLVSVEAPFDAPSSAEEVLKNGDLCLAPLIDYEGELEQISDPLRFELEGSKAVESVQPQSADVKEHVGSFDESKSMEDASSGPQAVEITASSSSVTTEVSVASPPPVLVIDEQHNAPDDGPTIVLSSATPSAKSYKNLKKHTPTHVQRQEHASHATRLPSVLDVAKYFPPRHNVSARSSNDSIDNSKVSIGITRKKIESYSVRRLSQRELEKMDARHQKNLEERKKEEERVHRAKVLEYQQIYAESRKAFKEEQQRILLEKMDRDNQRDHDAEVEQHEREAAKLDAKLQQNDEGIRGTVVGDGKTLLWDLIQVSDQPTSRIYRFQDALSQVLDVAQFADKMCAERARELRQRIYNLHHASCGVDSQLEALELRLLSELDPLTELQRSLQAKYAGRLRRRLERMLHLVQSWQVVLDGWESGQGDCSSSKYWENIQALYASSSPRYSSDASRRKLVLNDWRGGAGGDSLLHVAAWNGWDQHVQFLIEQGADVNVVDTSASHTTPLHVACRAGHTVVVQFLINAGARLTAVDSSGDSALHIACRGGWTRVVRILLAAADSLTAVVAGAVSSMHLASCEDVDTDKSVFTFTAAAFFNLRNGKGKRAIEVATLSSLIEELEQYDRLWIDEAKLLRDKDAVPIDHKARKHVMVGSGH